MVLMIVLLMVALVPAAAGAQTAEEKAAALADLEEKADELGGADAAEWGEAATTFRESLNGFKEVEPEVETGDLEDALDALDTAIEGGDIDEIAAAGEVVKAEAAIVAAAVAAAGGGAAAAAAVSSGDEVDYGPNVALLAVAAILALLAGGTLVVRRKLDPR